MVMLIKDIRQFAILFSKNAHFGVKGKFIRQTLRNYWRVFVPWTRCFYWV